MSPLQVLFLGTGTSTSLPLAPCLTRSFPYPEPWEHHVPRPVTPPPGQSKAGHYDGAGPWPRNIICACCRSTQDRDIPEGWKNRRGNTSLIVRKRGADGEWKNILVDCGKTFVENTRRFFPRWGVRTIDAVLLTHGHADAYFGLDDLREWCIRSGRPIPVYLNQETYITVAESFPYLVDASKASGGGDIPNLRFNVIKDLSTFTICDIQVDSFPVHHGIYFAPADPKASSSTEAEARPLICLAYAFDRGALYMGDVSEVPERTWSALESSGMAGPSTSSKAVQRRDPQPDPSGISVNGLADRLDGTVTVNGTSPEPNDTFSTLQILIIDALWPLRRHLSHYSFGQALDTALRIRPRMTYLLGATHPTTHFMWEEVCLEVSNRKAVRAPNPSSSIDWRSTHPDRETSDWLIDRVRSNAEFAGSKTKETSGILARWADFGGEVEPAWDGLVLELNGPVDNSISSRPDAQTTLEGWSVVGVPEGSVGGWGV